MLLYRPIGSSEDLQQLQSDVDRVNEWVISNHLSLNPVKCKTMLITKKINPIQPPQLQLNGIPLEQVEHFKYLGALFSSDLSWSTHIDSICSKARKLVGLLYSSVYHYSVCCVVTIRETLWRLCGYGVSPVDRYLDYLVNIILVYIYIQ